MKNIKFIGMVCLVILTSNLVSAKVVYGEDNLKEHVVEQENKSEEEQLKKQYESDNRKSVMSLDEYQKFHKIISNQDNTEYNQPNSPSLKSNFDTASSVRDQIVAEAKKHLGKPYTQTNPTRLGPNAFDCSGLAYYVYKTVTGKDIKNVTWEQEYSGQMISIGEAQPGDLYFWGARGNTSHVAICIGNQQYIHAPDFGKTVEISPIWDSFKPSFAVRILPDTPAQKFKINDRVKIKKTATNWVGSSKLTDYDYTRVLLVEGYESNGVKLRIPGEWAGIIKESDLEKVTPAFKKGDYVKIKRTATKWVGSSNLSDNDYKRTHIVEGINSNGAITIRIPGSWAGSIREEDLEIDNTISDFKVGTNVSFGLDALKWIGGADIGYDNMMRSYKISKLNGDGTIYVRTLDDAWGGNVSINDLMLLRANNIASNDVIKLRAAATNWVDGKPINIENKTTRSFIVKERKDNKLHIYSDAASGWSAWIYDWDALLERKHKVTPEIDYDKKYVVMNQNSSVWNAYKGVSLNVKISLSEYDSVYKVVDKNSESTKIQSVTDSSIFGWVYNNQVSAAPNSISTRGDKVKLKSSASRWTNGEAINIDNKTTRTFLVKERKDNQLLLYSDAGWQEWAYDWDVNK